MIAAYFALACAITWTLDAPIALSFATGADPPAWGLPLAGLGAFGPLLAAVIVTRWTGTRLRSRWTLPWPWIVLALVVPLLAHLPATAIEVALGGAPRQWFYPPTRVEFAVALVVFSFGEEPGWRGLAYPALADRWGAVPAALTTGAVWGLWHLGMMFTPEDGAPSAWLVGQYVAELGLWSVVVAWLFERSGRSLPVAIAAHMGGHLDNVNHAPLDEVRLRILRFAVLALFALAAAVALRRPKGLRV